MAVKLTKRDVIVVFLTGSSNAAGQQSEPDQLYSEDTSPATLPHCFFWNRYTDAANRTGTSLQLGHAFESVTNLLNFQEDGPSQMYFIGRKLEERYFPETRTAAGSPRGIYFVHMPFSSSSVCLDLAAIAPTVGMNPYSENVADTGPWQIWAEGYCRWALKNLEDEIAAGTLDNIYVDGAYYIGDESSCNDPAGAFANDDTRFSLATGILDWCREMENFCSIPRGTMPYVGTKIPLQIIGAAGIANVSDIEDARAQQELAAARRQGPTAFVDGDKFQLKSDNSHYTTDSVARIGIALADKRMDMGLPPVLKTSDVANAVQPIDSDE